MNRVKNRAMTQATPHPSAIRSVRFCSATLMLLVCLGCHDQAPKSVDDTAPKTPIEVATVHPQSVTDSLVLAARVEPDPTRVVHVFSQITGRLV